MKAIAWDDGRKNDQMDYMSRLAVELKRYGINMDVESETHVFEDRIRTGSFDFYVSDWFNTGGQDSVPQREEDPGGDLLINAIRQHNKIAPIFIVSRHTGRVDNRLLGGFRPIFLKSKDVNVKWMAYDIRENLRDLGIMVNSKRVFIIYGHDRKAEGATRQLKEWLCGKGVEVVLFDAVRSSTGIFPDLMRDMNACAAFIAICTPDDYCEEGLNRGNRWWQPRENVLFEMGIVFGLHRGAHRLTILQKWVDSAVDECARLPSDWGGYVTIRFSAGIGYRFEELEERLSSLGVNFEQQPTRPQ
jgi:predicted nucleotide-binding protein